MWLMRDDRQERFLAQVNALRSNLLAYCRHAVYDRESFEDVLQTVLAIAYEKFDDFRTGTQFHAWLFRIACNVVSNSNRKHVRESERTADTDLVQLDIVAELQREYAYDELLRDPDQILNQVGDELFAALRSLPLNELNVFLLKSVADLTCREIGEILQIPIGTVMCHLARARGKLRTSLSEYAKRHGFLSGEVKHESRDELRER